MNKSSLLKEAKSFLGVIVFCLVATPILGTFLAPVIAPILVFFLLARILVFFIETGIKFGPFSRLRKAYDHFFNNNFENYFALEFLKVAGDLTVVMAGAAALNTCLDDFLGEGLIITRISYYGFMFGGFFLIQEKFWRHIAEAEERLS